MTTLGDCFLFKKAFGFEFSILMLGIKAKMFDNKYGSRLRPLVEEYMVDVELKQFEKVCELSIAINDCLVEILDDGLEASNQAHDLNDNELSKNYEFSREVEIIATICRQLRYQGHIAATYDKVIHFVQLRDLVCFSKLLGAIPDTDDGPDEFDYDCFARVVRQSIELLAYINSDGADRRPIKEMWLDRYCLQRETSIGFPRYVIDTEKALSIQEKSDNLEAMLAAYNQGGLQQETSNKVSSLINADWFVQFLHRTLIPPIPVDRFTVLVAILIIGVECRHRALVQLIYELIDQVYHEEANSGSSEDLMTLSQVGSFWLSYHKRHRATMKQANRPTMRDDEDLGDIADIDELSSSDDVSSEASIMEQVAGSSGAAPKVKPIVLANHTPIDLRSRMRRLIDSELLYGRQCLICSHSPTSLLGPITSLTGSGLCASCGFDNSSALSCAISHEPLNILGLNSVSQLVQNKLSCKMVILRPSEWVRELVAAKSFGLPGAHGAQVVVGEQVDISEKFERLTVIRASGGAGRSNKYSPDSSDEDQSDDDDSAASAADAPDTSPNMSTGDRSNNGLGSSDTSSQDDYLFVLRNFMRSRNSSAVVASNCFPLPPSELILMLKHLKQQQQQNGAFLRWLPICSSDLLLLATRSGGTSISVGCLASSASAGPQWQCSSHSSVSGLLLGCGRAFSSLALIRSGDHNPSLSDFTCPLCRRHLERIRTLVECLEA